MKKDSFTRKRPTSSNDYELAYNTIKEITTAAPVEVAPNNLAVFRKYAYDVAGKRGKIISTRKKGDRELIIYCLKCDTPCTPTKA